MISCFSELLAGCHTIVVVVVAVDVVTGFLYCWKLELFVKNVIFLKFFLSWWVILLHVKKKSWFNSMLDKCQYTIVLHRCLKVVAVTADFPNCHYYFLFQNVASDPLALGFDLSHRIYVYRLLKIKERKFRKRERGREKLRKLVNFN